MFGFNTKKKKKAEEKSINYAFENLYQFIGMDLPIINSDQFDYINRIWKNIGVVYECTNLIYKKVIKSPLVFYKVKNQRAYKAYKQLEKKDTPQAHVLKAQSLEEVEIPALEALLSNPNPQQSYENFIGVFVLSYLLTGNQYTYKQMAESTKRPIELWSFSDLHINSGGLTNPIKNYSQFYQTESQINYPAETIYHSKTPNPVFDMMGTQLYGVSPLRAYLEPLRTIEEANSQASKQMKNGGVLTLISPKREVDVMDSDQRRSMVDRFKNALTSNKQNDRLLVSSIGLNAEKIGIPVGDLDLLSIRSAIEESIYRLFGIPLARYSQKSSTQNNQAESNKQLVYDAIAPMCEIISSMLTKFVGIHFDNTIIELDYTQLPEMAVNMKEMSDYLIPLLKVGVVSRDEARYQFGYSETSKDYMMDFWYESKPLAKLYTEDINQTQTTNNGDNKNNN